MCTEIHQNCNLCFKYKWTNTLGTAVVIWECAQSNYQCLFSFWLIVSSCLMHLVIHDEWNGVKLVKLFPCHKIVSVMYFVFKIIVIMLQIVSLLTFVCTDNIKGFMFIETARGKLFYVKFIYYLLCLHLISLTFLAIIFPNLKLIFFLLLPDSFKIFNLILFWMFIAWFNFLIVRSILKMCLHSDQGIRIF